MRIAVNWQNKSLGYFTGFHAVDVAPELLSKFEISTAYPSLSKYYGFLVGPAHTIPTAIFGLVAGSAAKYGNTKLILLGVLGILSGFQFTYGLADSFALFMFLKVVS